MEEKEDLLKFAFQKEIVKMFQFGEQIFLSCQVLKFNDYKKKQERNLLITTKAVYNLKGTDIKRRIPLEKIKALSVSKMGTEFVLHIPSEYDYRYASSDLRQKIIYYTLKGIRINGLDRLPIYSRDELGLVFYAMTKEDKKKQGVKYLKGKCDLYDDKSYYEYLRGEQEEKQIIRKTTKTLFAKNFQEQITIFDFNSKVVLGKGAFGTVELVEKKNTKELFAMKSIDKIHIIKKDQLEHTRTEKMILEHVNHPFLVNLVYAFQTSKKLYFVMQFMRGGQLFQHLLKAKKFPQKQVKFYAMQLALALGHLHEKDFIYRDLKLENVLMDQFGNVSLTDFGMAKIIREGQLTNTFCGTPEYLAPQILNGLGYDKCADWWSLGVLIFQLLFGLPPFYHKSQQEMFRRIKAVEYHFTDKIKITDNAKKFISRLLDKNPKTRLGSKGQILQVLSHPWFSDLDCEKMLRKQIKPPYKPKIDGEDWLDGFDPEFTSQKLIQHDPDERPEMDISEYEKVFKGF